MILGFHGKKVMTSLQPVRNNANFKLPLDLYKNVYFRMKEESAKQSKSTSTNLVRYLKIITPLDPRNTKYSKIIMYLVT